jgi:DNA-binding response OmpR family regulator
MEVGMTAGRILIVDDEPHQRRTLSYGLTIEGFVVAQAADAAEALELLDVAPYDLAIVDLMMPGVNGLELVRRMRFRHPHVMVVLTSAYHLSDIQLRKIGLDAVAFIAKPYSLADISSYLRDRLERAALARA